MILWINGAFGSGKTQTAFEINRRLENSFVYDPENIGYFLRKNMPREIIQGNFQDQPLWRTFNYEIIKTIYANFGGHIIIPMTIYNKNYYDEIIGKLLREDAKICHFILGASKAVILKRLSRRLERKNSWAAQQIDLCLRGFDELKENSVYIDTDALAINEVAETVAEKAGIKLQEDRDAEIIRKIKRAMTQIKHIRWLF
jgi:RNase adaptor protein for sRNA GlmZ degradation